MDVQSCVTQSSLWQVTKMHGDSLAYPLQAVPLLCVSCSNRNCAEDAEAHGSPWNGVVACK